MSLILKKGVKLSMSSEKTKPKPKKQAKTVVREIRVSLGRSKKGSQKKTDELMTKSDDFDHDMAVIGEIKEKGQDNGIIGIRLGMYDERLILKIFDGNVRCLGTMEETPTMAYLVRATGKTIDYPHFKVLLPGYRYVIDVRKVYGGFLKPEKYSFFIHFEDPNDKNNIHNEFFSISQKRLSIGDDWFVRDAADGIVAKLDGRKTAIGSNWDIYFYPTTTNLHLNDAYVATLILFTAFRRYEKDIMKRLSKNYENYRRRNIKLPLNWHEMTLYKNPRYKESHEE